MQPWAEKRVETLSRCTGQPVRSLDFSDDRLGDVLRALSQDAVWEECETALNGHVPRVYRLDAEYVRVDSTTASSHRLVTPEGLFQFGQSKDGRPDLPQVKVMLSTLDPLGMPVAASVLPGQCADDPLYIPAVRQVRKAVGQGMMDVGDCKMGALATRAFLQAGGDDYLCPLSEVQMPPEALETYLTPVWQDEQALPPVFREKEHGEREQVAKGFERQERLTAAVDGHTITWTERRLMVRSLKQAHAAEAAVRDRLRKAQTALEALNERRRGKRRFPDGETLQQAAEAVVARYGVQGLVCLQYAEAVRERPVRGYGGRSARMIREREVRLTVAVDDQALAKAIRRLGWRVYVTNASVERLSLERAVWAYRGQYVIDRGMGRLKGRPLSLTPMYLMREDRATGLIRLLTVALRVLTLLEFVARRNLAARGETLAGLYAGNPQRATMRPTAERVLEAFREINLTVIQAPDHTHRHLTPLSGLQQRILALLDFSADIYARLCLDSVDSAKPP